MPSARFFIPRFVLAVLACAACSLSRSSPSRRMFSPTTTTMLAPGLNPLETTLTLSNVNSAPFGKLFTLTVDGLVDAEPFISRLSPSRAAAPTIFLLWPPSTTRSMLSMPTAAPKSGTSPLSSRARQLPTIVTAPRSLQKSESPPRPPSAAPQDLTGLSTRSPCRRIHPGTIISAFTLSTPPPATNSTKAPSTLPRNSLAPAITVPAAMSSSIPPNTRNAPACFLLDGMVYLAWASHCDIRPYTGWVMGYSHHARPGKCASTSPPTATKARLGRGRGASPPTVTEISFSSMPTESSTPL